MVRIRDGNWRENGQGPVVAYEKESVEGAVSEDRGGGAADEGARGGECGGAGSFK